MEIQFDTPHSIGANDAFRAPIIDMLNEKLERFDKHVSRLEVHLSDENGNKAGVNDKRCLLEAHIAGMPHVVVSDHATSYEQAADGAAQKLVGQLQSIHSRQEHDIRARKQEEATDIEN